MSVLEDNFGDGVRNEELWDVFQEGNASIVEEIGQLAVTSGIPAPGGHASYVTVVPHDLNARYVEMRADPNLVFAIDFILCPQKYTTVPSNFWVDVPDWIWFRKNLNYEYPGNLSLHAWIKVAGTVVSYLGFAQELQQESLMRIALNNGVLSFRNDAGDVTFNQMSPPYTWPFADGMVHIYLGGHSDATYPSLVGTGYIRNFVSNIPVSPVTPSHILGVNSSPSDIPFAIR